MGINLIDLKTYDNNTFNDIQCKMELKKKLLSDEGYIRLVGEKHYEMVTKDGIYKFQIVNSQDERLISDRLKQKKGNLAQAIMTSNDSDIFFLHVVFFHNTTHEGKWNIVLSDKVKKAIIDKKLIRKGREFEDEVRENFTLFNGNSSCFAYTSGKYDFTDSDCNNDYSKKLGEETQKNDTEDDGETQSLNKDEFIIDTEIPVNEKLKNIKIYGKDYSLLIRMRGSEGNEFLCAEKIDTINRNIPSMVLGIGQLTFKDNQAFVSEKVRKELEMTSGYLDLWEQYTKLEGDFLLKKARAIGTFSINKEKNNRTNEGIVINPIGLSKEGRKLLVEGDYLMFSDNTPVYIADENMSWSEYKEYTKNLKSSDMPQEITLVRRIVKVDPKGYIVLDATENDTIPDGMVSLSILGDLLQINRRETARELIANGESANPALGLIIEGRLSDNIEEPENVKKIDPFSSFVRNKIFENDPTITQKEAIKIALNTPDIAIIQGPPGTGKTKVITAIIERLNELADKRNDNRGQVLITSFQHDAVRNVVERLSVNSLPTIKFGKKGKDDMSMERIIEEWCGKYANEIKVKNPSMQTTLEQKELARLHDLYLFSPSDVNALNFLKYAKSLVLDNSLLSEIEKVIEDITIRDDEKTNNLIVKIRRIRTTKESFADDGADVADDLLGELDEIMDSQIKDNKVILEVLDEAACCIGHEPSDELLKKLNKVKMDLLKKCSQRPSYKIEEPREEILDLYIKIGSTLKKPQNDVDEILFNLLNELENNTSEVENSIIGYNFVYAATTQQSEGNDIRKAKNVRGNEHPEYDTVIIDEAARVNPGDLMIPMAQAKRRIILVGDHRQLPHIYDEEIFESMEQNDSSIDKNVVKISMFEYLMQKADELYKKDKIPRTITLDAQYRTHPLLGDFVSDNFYKEYGESFTSPLPAKNFEQNLFDKPLVWADFPDSAGSEEKEGTSRIRKCEAEYIADRIREYINSDKGKDLSYGVITFYRAQVELIKKKLGDLADKVRVGSVDAFQGMEFDVIFLSVVRSHNNYPQFDSDLLNMDVKGLPEDEETYRKWDSYRLKVGLANYGFLTSENRLCVALSRQKKLLIVVGNSAIFHDSKWGELAEKCVPAMKHLYELCQKEGVLING